MSCRVSQGQVAEYVPPLVQAPTAVSKPLRSPLSSNYRRKQLSNKPEQDKNATQKQVVLVH